MAVPLLLDPKELASFICMNSLLGSGTYPLPVWKIRRDGREDTERFEKPGESERQKAANRRYTSRFIPRLMSLREARDL